ncbi:DUF2089 family protein [Macrococcus hajekii]|uniref:DUF2089 family protein n=1 Tax=Macrococcus hajekii TaxID=198482 RepID=A0A4R6BLR2_9STAP|nr:DUF2089 family protein [Macrococcus hajekii]TDM02739.1 DUF2089 family protein [Macrococcus hajekii]GGB03475.1 hypothetical protein GCM10007190_09370 [Macrococcus hajekii]
MNKDEIPEWILTLDKEDIQFIKNFLLESGSLKSIAKLYDVSYPTVRVRLDNLINKVRLSDQNEHSHLISYIKSLAIDEVISLDEAKKLINLYKEEKGE